MSRTFSAVLALFALVLAACSDSGTGLDGALNGNVGTVKASYSGHITGQINATGELKYDALGDPVKRSFAAAFTNPNGWSGSIIWGAEVDGNTGEGLAIFTSGTQKGTYTVGEDCIPGANGCAMVILFRDGNLDLDDNDVTRDPSETEYFAIDGTVTITDVTDKRIKGTFSANAGLDSDAYPSYQDAPKISIRNGSFDVPIRSDLPFRGGASSTRSSIDVANLSRVLQR